MNKKSEIKPLFFTDHPVGDDHFPIYEKYASQIAQVIQRSFEESSSITGTFRRVIAIVGPWGSGKMSLFNLAVSKLSNWGKLWFRPTSFDNESEIAAAFVRTALKQINVASKGFSRLYVKIKIWWHNLNLRGGMGDLVKQIIILLFRLLVFVGTPIIINILLPENIKTYGTVIAAAFGGTVAFGDRVKQAFSPGLNLNPDKFIRKVKATSTTNEIDFYVEEFRWIANLARSIKSPLVVLVDPIDDGLPRQTALILETLRLFGTRDTPCSFVIFLDDFVSLKAAIHARFISQMNIYNDDETLRNLKKIADLYLQKAVNIFEIKPPSEEEVKQYMAQLTSGCS